VPDDDATLIDLDQVLGAFTRLVDGVGPDQWTRPTPCAEWDVRHLVDHVTTGDRMIAALASGEQPQDPQQLQQFRARLSPAPGDDPMAAAHDAAERLREAVARPGFLGRRYPTFMGEQPGGFLVQMRITENLIHGWDLARATSQRAGFPEAVVERTLAAVRVSLAGRPRDPGGFGVEQPAPEGAPSLDRLAAFMGRSL